MLKVQHGEQDQILRLIKEARKDPSWELEVRFEDVPSGSKGRRSFSPTVTLNSFLHIKNQIIKQDACIFRGDVVTLDTIYASKVRKTERILENGETETSYQQKAQYAKFDSNYGFRVSLSKETALKDADLKDNNNPQVIRLKRRSCFTAYNGPDKLIPVWNYDLTVTQSAKMTGDPPEKVERILDNFRKIRENIAQKRSAEDSLIRDFSQEQYEVELEYIGNKHIFQMRTRHVYEIFMNLIGWIMENNRTHAARGCLLSKDETKLVLDQYLTLINMERYDIEIDGLNYDQLVRRYAMQTRQSGPVIRQTYPSKDSITYAFKTLESIRVGSITDYFVGPQPVAMTRSDLDQLVPEHYCVQRKIDGERNLLFVSALGIVYLISRDMYIKRTSVPRITELSSTIIDGEFLYDGQQNHFYPFDIIVHDGKDLRGQKQFDFPQRYRLLRMVLKAWPQNQDALIVRPEYLKQIQFDLKLPLQENLQLALSSSSSSSMYDGLIFRPLHRALPRLTAAQTWWHCFKWKQPCDNTIDFMVQHDNDSYWNLMCRTQVIPLEIKGQEHESTVLYRKRKEGGQRVLNVFVPDLQGEIEVDEKQIMRNPQTRKRTRTQMISFGSVVNNPDIGRIKILEPQAKRLCIVDRCVAECRFDSGRQCFEPIKVRWDKTMNNNPNFIATAVDIWDSINHPIEPDDLLALGGGGGDDSAAQPLNTPTEYPQEAPDDTNKEIQECWDVLPDEDGEAMELDQYQTATGGIATATNFKSTLMRNLCWIYGKEAEWVMCLDSVVPQHPHNSSHHNPDSHLHQHPDSHLHPDNSSSWWPIQPKYLVCIGNPPPTTTNADDQNVCWLDFPITKDASLHSGPFESQLVMDLICYFDAPPASFTQELFCNVTKSLRRGGYFIGTLRADSIEEEMNKRAGVFGLRLMECNSQRFSKLVPTGTLLRVEDENFHSFVFRKDTGDDNTHQNTKQCQAIYRKLSSS